MEIPVRQQWQNPAQQTENVEENEPLFVAEHTEATPRSQVRKAGKPATQARRKHRDGSARECQVFCRRIPEPRPCRDVRTCSFPGTRRRCRQSAANPESPPPVLCNSRNQGGLRRPCASLSTLAGRTESRPGTAAPQWFRRAPNGTPC